MPPLLLRLVVDRIATAPAPFFVQPIKKGIAKKAMSSFIGPQIKTHFGFIESELQGRDWFAGEAFSAADIMMSFPLEGAAKRAAGSGKFANCQSFVEKIHARPAYKRALERGGPYAYA